MPKGFTHFCSRMLTSGVFLLIWSVDAPLTTSNSPAADPPTLESAKNLCRIRNFDAAVKEYNELIKTASQPSLAYAGLSRALLRLHKLKEAYAAASKAVDAASFRSI